MARGTPIYPEAPKRRAARRPLARLDAVDGAAGRSPGVLGIDAHPAGRSATWLQIQKDADAARRGLGDRRPPAVDAPLHGRRSVHARRHRGRRLCAALARRRGDQQPRLAASRALVRRARRAGRDLQAIRRAADDVTARIAQASIKARTLEQQNADDQHKRDAAIATSRRPAHAAADTTTASRSTSGRERGYRRNGARAIRSAPYARADADRAADLHAGVGALDLDEARAVGGAGIRRRPSPFSGSRFVGSDGCRASAGAWTRRRRAHGRRQRDADRRCTEKAYRIPALYRGSRQALIHALRTNLSRPTCRGARPPAVPPGAGIARKRQPHHRPASRRIVDRDLGARGGDILHHAWRAAKPPSSVIHADCRSVCGLPASWAEACSVLRSSQPYSGPALETVDLQCRLRVPASTGRKEHSALPGRQTPLYVRPPQSPPGWASAPLLRRGQIARFKMHCNLARILLPSSIG